MKTCDKLVFVGTGNTSVSPMAEAILQDRFKLEDILIESKGLVVLFPEPVNPKAEEVLEENGLNMQEHMSSPFSANEFDERNLIITIRESQKEKILKEYEQAVNVYTLCEYLGYEEVIGDPYGRSIGEYRQCFRVLKELVNQLADKLKQEDSQ